MKLFFRYCHSSVLMCLISSITFAEVSKTDFRDVNEVIIHTHAPMVRKRLNSTIDLVELYGDYGGAFKVDSARKPLGESRYIITLTGKIPQSDPMNMDGYAIVACHELGHVLGGEPRLKNALDQWSSVEGRADLYATNECMWKYVAALRSTTLIKDFDRDFIARCDSAFHGDLEKTIGCLRILSGIQAMVEYFNRTSAKEKPVSIFAKDETKVEATIQKYPSPQCRVDTWVAGLFNETWPRCWFKG